MSQEQPAKRKDRTQISTDRREAVVMKAISVGLNSLSFVAPRLAGRLASYMWFTPFPFSRGRAPQIPSGARRVTFGSGESVVHGYEIGEGPLTALLIHGWAGSSRQFRRTALRLVDDGYRCLVIDLPAHGIEAGRSTHVPEAADAIETVAAAVGPIDLVVAHSLGAMATSVAFQGALETDRLVFLAPAVRPRTVFESFAANLRLRPVVAAAIEAEMNERFGHDMWERIPNGTLNLDVPEQTLIIHDLDDEMMSINESRVLAEHWGVQLMTTQGNGHNGVLRASQVIDQIAELAATEPVSN